MKTNAQLVKEIADLIDQMTDGVAFCGVIPNDGNFALIHTVGLNWSTVVQSVGMQIGMDTLSTFRTCPGLIPAHADAARDLFVASIARGVQAMMTPPAEATKH